MRNVSFPVLLSLSFLPRNAANPVLMCIFTLIEKHSFNCMFKLELENQLLNALFVFFV